MGRFHVVRQAVACCALIGSAAFGQNVAVNNGSQFTTTTGDAVQAHGAGIVKVGNYYYMLGENRDGWLFKAVSMYRSTDLNNWEFRRDILTRNSAPSLNTSNIERPKVIYNAATNKYVLWAHKENGCRCPLIP
ncbi:hypothetical protein [Sphingomonas paucimobilis]|uniref:hypothetical protein n=1 Tax=Sphingomonas paucimobilis TaxID=13689 RepID=UPI00242BB8C3|nr:hypothetical protein [Sphingomonas paucimobilis]